MIRKSPGDKRDSVNNSLLQKSSVKYRKNKNTPSVPVPQFTPNYDIRHRDHEQIDKIPDVMEENSNSGSEEMPYSNKFQRKLSNNGKYPQDKGSVKVSFSKNKRGSRFNDNYLISGGAPIKSRDEDSSSITKKISKHLQSNQNIGKQGFSGTGGIFSFERNGSNVNEYNYEIPDNQ